MIGNCSGPFISEIYAACQYLKNPRNDQKVFFIRLNLANWKINENLRGKFYEENLKIGLNNEKPGKKFNFAVIEI